MNVTIEQLRLIFEKKGSDHQFKKLRSEIYESLALILDVQIDEKPIECLITEFADVKLLIEQFKACKIDYAVAARTACYDSDVFLIDKAAILFHQAAEYLQRPHYNAVFSCIVVVNGCIDAYARQYGLTDEMERIMVEKVGRLIKREGWE